MTSRLVVHRGEACREGVVLRHELAHGGFHAWCLACEGGKCPVCSGRAADPPARHSGSDACAVGGCALPKRKGRWCAAHEKKAFRLGSPTARKCVGCGDVVDMREVEPQLGTERFRCSLCLARDEDQDAPPTRTRERARAPGTAPDQAALLEGRARAAARGVRTGPVPFGYRRVPGRRGRIEIDPVEAEVVRFVFRLYRRRRTIRGVLRALRAEGYVTRSGKPWSGSGVSWLLGNRTYLGELRFGKIVKLRAHPALVRRAHFEEVQAIMRENA